MKQTITIEVTDEEYHAFRSALAYCSNQGGPLVPYLPMRRLFDKVMIARQTQNNVGAKKCHTCMRPFKKLTNEQRARSSVGTGHELTVAKSLGDLSGACEKVHELLIKSARIANGWVSRDRLSRELNGGDGARRVRHLRDEYGIPIEVTMRVNPNGTRQAYYRLAQA